jgi:hypothetical protein
MQPEERRFSLSLKEVPPGETVSSEIDFGTLKPGRYTLEADLVSEHVCWFQANCDSRITMDLLIEP